MRNPIGRQRRGRPPRALIAACIDGRCSGAFCPCLCHRESLHLGHHGHELHGGRARTRRVSPWRRRGSLVIAGLLAASIGFAIIADPATPIDSWLELGYGEANLDTQL